MSHTQTTLRRRANITEKQERSFLRWDHVVDKPWYLKIDWTNFAGAVVTLILGIYGILTTKFVWKTVVFAIFLQLWTQLSITAGYHRLWSHRAYKATWPLKVILLIGGTTSLQFSVVTWASLHRAHHRYTDTDKDPYNIKRGFWYAHIGWLISGEIDVLSYINIDDLLSDALVRFQYDYWKIVGPFFAVFLPTIIPYIFWDDLRVTLQYCLKSCYI